MRLAIFIPWPVRISPVSSKAMAFPEGVHQVEIIRLGNARLITPVGRRWDEFFIGGPQVSDDFMTEREQLSAEDRDPL